MVPGLIAHSWFKFHVIYLQPGIFATTWNNLRGNRGFYPSTRDFPLVRPWPPVQERSVGVDLGRTKVVVTLEPDGTTEAELAEFLCVLVVDSLSTNEANDDVVEVSSTIMFHGLTVRNGGKGGVRCPFNEARLLPLLQTAGSVHYSSIRFDGKNLTHGAISSRNPRSKKKGAADVNAARNDGVYATPI